MAEWFDWVGLGDVTVQVVDFPHIEMSGIYSRSWAVLPWQEIRDYNCVYIHFHWYIVSDFPYSAAQRELYVMAELWRYEEGRVHQPDLTANASNSIISERVSE